MEKPEKSEEISQEVSLVESVGYEVKTNWVGLTRHHV